jgi:hypothetical protein
VKLCSSQFSPADTAATDSNSGSRRHPYGEPLNCAQLRTGTTHLFNCDVELGFWEKLRWCLGRRSLGKLVSWPKLRVKLGVAHQISLARLITCHAPSADLTSKSSTACFPRTMLLAEISNSLRVSSWVGRRKSLYSPNTRRYSLPCVTKISSESFSAEPANF